MELQEHGGSQLDGRTPGAHRFLSRPLARVRAWLTSRVLVADTMLAVVLCALCTSMVNDAGLSFGLLHVFGTQVQQVWSLVFVVPLALRRYRPQTGALLFVGVVLAHLVFGPVLVLPDLLAPLMVYSVIAYGDPRRTRWFLVLAAVMDVAASLVVSLVMTAGPLSGRPQWYSPMMGVCVSPADGPGWLTRSCAVGMAQYAVMMAAMVAVCLLGAIVMAYWQRARMATVQAMRERNAAIVAREAEEQRIAAAAERARIARDMHDVVAHTLSIIIVQSDGGRYAGVHDPAVARTTMATIRHEAARALHDMRRLFGVFGNTSPAAYRDLDALLSQARAALATDGSTLTRRIEGTPRPEQLDAGADEAVYRLVQEALTNVRKYAGSRVHVDVTEQWSDTGLRITVQDTGRGASAAADGHTPGYGLLGMRERLAAVGGQVEAGPCRDGGFRVAAVVPLQSSAGTADHTAAAAVTNSVAVTGNVSGTVSAASADTSDSAAPTGTGRTAHIADTLRRLAAALRSRPVTQADGGGRRFNLIERLSRWTQRHYLAIDVMMAGVLLWLVWCNGFWGPIIGRGVYAAGDEQIWTVVACCTVAPLAFRRRFPEASAAAAAAFSAVQLLFFPSIYACSALVLVSVYAAVLYGRPTAWRWVSITVVAEACLFGVKAVSDRTVLFTLFLPGMSHVGLGTVLSLLLSGILLGMMSVGVLGLGTVAMARWTRSRGTNALVLQQREEALRAEQERLRVMAANMERDRISAAIQEEVTATLTGVTKQAETGLRMLDEAAARGVQPSPAQITEAFASIGRQGRAALAHMRQLLSMLRQTGSSDTGHPAAGTAMPLAPAAPLDQQLQQHHIAHHQG